MPLIHEFIKEIDRRWVSRRGDKAVLRIIGAGALMLQADYERGTKDGDILETAELDGETKAGLLAIAGPGTPVARRHRMYLEFVASGLPLLPQAPAWVEATELNRDLKNFGSSFCTS